MTAAAREATLSLLASRSLDATVCPSGVARAIASGDERRAAMSAVHSAVDRRFDEGVVRASWKGKNLATRAGHYRISRA
jgi:hypothetical protein